MAGPYTQAPGPLDDPVTPYEPALPGLDEPLVSAGRRYALPRWSPKPLSPYVEDPGHAPGETMLFASDPETGPRRVADAWPAPAPPMPPDASPVNANPEAAQGGAGPGTAVNETFEEEQARRYDAVMPQALWEQRYAPQFAATPAAPPSPGKPTPPAPPRVAGGRGSAAAAPTPQLPEALRPEFGGMFYPADYEQRVWNHLGVKGGDDLASLSPEQLDVANRALAGYRQYLNGPVGLAVREQNLYGELDQMQLEQQRRALELQQQEQASMAELRARQIAAERKATESAQIRLVAAQEAAKAQDARIAAADKDVRDYRVDARLDPVSGALSIVAEALGTLGAGLAKMPNVAHDIIEKAIDRKVATQRVELEKRERGAGKARNDLEAYWRHFGNIEQAEDALTQRYLNEFADQAALVASQTQSQRAQAALSNFEEFARKNAELRDVQQRKALAELYFAQRAGGARRPDKGPIVPGTLEYRVTGAEAKDLRERWIPKVGFLGSQGDRKDAISKFSQYNAVVSRATTIEKILQEEGNNPNWGAVAARLRSVGGQFLAAESLSLGQGVVTGNDPMRDTLPDATKILESRANVLAAVQAARALADKDRSYLVDLYGVEPGTMEEREENGKSVYYVRKRPVSDEQAYERERKADEAAGTAGPEPASGGAAAARRQREIREWEAQQKGAQR